MANELRRQQHAKDLLEDVWKEVSEHPMLAEEVECMNDEERRLFRADLFTIIHDKMKEVHSFKRVKKRKDRRIA